MRRLLPGCSDRFVALVGSGMSSALRARPDGQTLNKVDLHPFRAIFCQISFLSHGKMTLYGRVD